LPDAQLPSAGDLIYWRRHWQARFAVTPGLCGYEGNGGRVVTFAVVFALAAAFSNAVNLMTQHSASVAAPKREKGWRLALYLVR
jgi:hypothetical protein